MHLQESLQMADKLVRKCVLETSPSFGLLAREHEFVADIIYEQVAVQHHGGEIRPPQWPGGQKGHHQTALVSLSRAERCYRIVNSRSTRRSRTGARRALVASTCRFPGASTRGRYSLP